MMENQQWGHGSRLDLTLGSLATSHFLHSYSQRNNDQGKKKRREEIPNLSTCCVSARLLSSSLPGQSGSLLVSMEEGTGRTWSCQPFPLLQIQLL